MVIGIYLSRIWYYLVLFLSQSCVYKKANCLMKVVIVEVCVILLEKHRWCFRSLFLLICNKALFLRWLKKFSYVDVDNYAHKLEQQQVSTFLEAELSFAVSSLLQRHEFLDQWIFHWEQFMWNCKSSCRGSCWGGKPKSFC